MKKKDNIHSSNKSTIISNSEENIIKNETNNKNSSLIIASKNKKEEKMSSVILRDKKDIPIAISFLQADKTNMYEDSYSNYYESKNYKLDLNNLKLNLDVFDKTKNSFIDPKTNRECSFIQNSDINNSNFKEEYNNKQDNEVIICISNLDMKLEDSNFNPKNNRFNKINDKNEINFLQALNKKKKFINNFDKNNFYGRQCIIKNTDNMVHNNNNFIDNKFEEIKLNLNKIINNKEKNNLINSNDFSLVENKKYKINKLEFGSQTNKLDKNDDTKTVSSSKNDKDLDLKNFVTEYIDSENIITVQKKDKKKVFFKIIFILLLIVLMALLILIIIT